MSGQLQVGCKWPLMFICNKKKFKHETGNKSKPKTKSGPSLNEDPQYYNHGD